MKTDVGIKSAFALNYQLSRYHHAFININDTLLLLGDSKNHIDQTMILAAKNALIDIHAIYLSHDKSTRIHELTTALKVINNSLQNPGNGDALQSAIICGKHLPSDVQQAYFKYLIPLILVTHMATCITAIALACSMPLLQPMVNPVISLGDIISTWVMKTMDCQQAILPKLITEEALLTHITNSKLAEIAIMTHVNHQELTLAKKTPPAFHDPMLNNPNTKHHTQSLLQVMKTFKNGYTTHKERSHSMHSAATLVKQTIELNQESSNAIHQKSSM